MQYLTDYRHGLTGRYVECVECGHRAIVAPSYREGCPECGGTLSGFPRGEAEWMGTAAEVALSEPDLCGVRQGEI